MRRAEGFTMIEVVVGLLLAILTIGALSELFVSGSESSVATQRQAQLISVAEQQIEQIRQQVKTQGFDKLALSGQPQTSCASIPGTIPQNPTNPDDYVTCSGGTAQGYMIEVNYNGSSAGTPPDLTPWAGYPTGSEPLLIGGVSPLASTTGFVTPYQSSVSIGSGTGEVYTYVTAVNANACTSVTATGCTDVRRVIVAVHLDQTASRQDIGPNAPLYLSTIFARPVPSTQATQTAGLTLGVQLG